MEAVDLNQLERRARARYEWARSRGAALHAAPVLLIALLAASGAYRPLFVLGFGSAAFLLGAFMFWYGREAQRALLPGLVAGLVPLVCALGANKIGHLCMGDRCLQVCLAACAVGGLAAGLVVARAARAHAVRGAASREAGPMFWAAASTLALLTGLIGCSCVGYSGALGLLLGFASGAGPAWALRRVAAG
jgi:hypothetical protein